MVAKVCIGTGSLLGVGLMMLSMWAWQLGPHLMPDADRPDTVLWAARSASVAAAALAQTVLLVLVVGNIYRVRFFDRLLQVLTATVFAVSVVSAIALGLAGR